MLKRIKSTDLQLMYTTCKELRDKDLIQEVTKDYGDFYLNMKVYNWGEVHLQVSPFARFTGERKDTTVCGIALTYYEYEGSPYGGYYAKGVKEDEFRGIVF